MSKSKKIFVFFVILYILIMIFILYDFSQKSKAPWKKSQFNQEISFNLIR
tara:strand:- start:98 stop:247 length:150 start_codon:yes stop_codon:yes gene_type:complete